VKAKGPSKPLARKPRGPDLRGARLEELDRDQLSIFFYLTLLPEKAVALLERLNLSIVGFRPEGLGDIERSDLLADEFVTQPTNQKKILAAVAEEIAPIPEIDGTLGPAAAVLGPLFAVEGGAAKAIARMLLDPDPPVRENGLEVLNALADYYLGEPIPGAEPNPEGQAWGPQGGPPPDPTEALRRELQRTKERAETAEHERQARGDQLQQARREAADANSTLGEVRRMLGAAESDRDKLRTSLQDMQAGPHSPAEVRLRKEAEELKERIERLEEERRALRFEESRLKHALSKAADEQPAPEPPKPATDAEDDVAEEEAPPTWLMPVFTQEFYDSLPGWARRHQRAAFLKAMMLAQDHRRPSLRAIPLEGLDNLYRIRIATDVRLLYRRGEGNLIEILRLIDREDLDRWIKVEKLRS
jgi:regulator of replication initiation timing